MVPDMTHGSAAGCRPPLDQQVTFLYTRDLVASAAFYEQALGLPLVLDQGVCRIYRVAGGAFVGLCERGDTPLEPGGIIITLVTQEVDSWYAYLAARGVVFEKPPAFNPTYNIYHCFLRDPSGYLIEIQTFRDPTWPQASAADR
jgi:catechol 2,3-dioxygenase-like lactoylglutathione lyase family enzyme